MSAPVRVTLTLDGVTVIDRTLVALEARLSDMRPAWPEAVRVFQQIVARAFATEGGSTGAPWPALAPSTQAERRRLGFAPARPILRRTNRLFDALTTGTDANIAGGPTSLTYRLAPEVGYYAYHQSRRPRTRIPRRAMVELTGDDRNAILRPIRLHLTGRAVTGAQRGPWRDREAAR